LFSESAGRVLVTVDPGRADDLLGMAAEAGVPAHVLGTAGGEHLSIADISDLSLDELHTAWEGTLPALFG
jgi:phosphoribosylformylglycinamidine synthase